MTRFTPSQRVVWPIHLLALGAVLTACPQMPGAADSGMLPPVDGGCAGLVGCECAGGACMLGECIGGVCVDCRRGEAACSCRSNNTCNTGLRCNGTGRCETCPAGAMGCACGAGDTCSTGLVCSNGACVTDTCVAGTTTCPCRMTDPRCDGASYCDPMSLCRTCSNDVVGCACDAAGVCAGTAVCDGASRLCRAPISCADRVSSGACLPHQACVQLNGADAVCTPNSCEPQFKWDGLACVACVTQDCLNEPKCTDLDGGLGSTCATQNRSCNEAGGVASCGACLGGFAAGGTGPCQPVPACGATTCPIDQYCDRGGPTPACAPLPCPVGQARVGSGACSSMNCGPCSSPGLSGRVWPYRTATGICVCETLDSYFLLAAGGAPDLCDADGDGWVREDADKPTIRAEPALRDNARCSITAVTRVRLVDEYGLSVDVLSCTNGLQKASLANSDGGVPNGGLGLFLDGGLLPVDGGAACPALVPLRLLETLANDVPGTPRGVGAPAYGARQLEANELNSLTKACVSPGADFNDNRIEDAEEVQGTVVASPPAAEPDRQVLEQFAYFIELESSAVEGGVLVIRERSRCDATFPLRYDPAVRLDGGVPSPSDLYSLSNDNPYWRTCSRNRDSLFSKQSSKPGFDFAQWSCDEASGSCPKLAPPPHPTLVGSQIDTSVLLMRNHGLCRLNGALPADRLWRGLNHHSQFKCVNVLAGPVASPNDYDRLPGDFGVANNLLTFNTCSARACSTPGDPACSRPQGVGAQTRQAVIDCTATASPSSGKMGFAAVNYRPYRFGPPPGSAAEYTGAPSSYERGCVNEDDTEWQPYLCPYPDFTTIKANADGRFGRYSCYKYQPNFLWAGSLPDGGSNVGSRSNLFWGIDTRGSVLGPRLPPDGGL